jgi:hypothetical protein
VADSGSGSDSGNGNGSEPSQHIISTTLTCELVINNQIELIELIYIPHFNFLTLFV